MGAWMAIPETSGAGVKYVLEWVDHTLTWAEHTLTWVEHTLTWAEHHLGWESPHELPETKRRSGPPSGRILLAHLWRNPMLICHQNPDSSALPTYDHVTGRRRNELLTPTARKSEATLTEMPRLSKREREVMDIVHELGAATAARIRERMTDPPTDAAVRSVLRILVEKGHLDREYDGPRYVYSPTVSARRARSSAMKTCPQDVLRRLGGGCGRHAAPARG